MFLSLFDQAGALLSYEATTFFLFSFCCRLPIGPYFKQYLFVVEQRAGGKCLHV